MKFTKRPMMLFIYMLTLYSFFGCSKDSDLFEQEISNRVNEELENDGEISEGSPTAFFVEVNNDEYSISGLKSRTILPVVENDSIEVGVDFKIISIGDTEQGTVDINADNTLSYSPFENENLKRKGGVAVDDFTYTLEAKDDSGSVITKTGIVKVNTEYLGELKAFPGAEGFGQNASGGRDGSVVFVTNLNTSGPGSFQNAIDTGGKRTIIFKVSGIIDYGGEKEIHVNKGDLTIAGETAPGDGITIKGATLNIEVDNIIVRHIRIRQTSKSKEDDCLRIIGWGSPVSNIIIDHVSLSFGTDENLSITNAFNVTVQNSIISDNKGSGAVLVGSSVTKSTFYANALIWAGDRTPRASYGGSGYEWINNYVYGFTAEMINSFGVETDVRGSVWENKTSNTDTYTINISQNNQTNTDPSLTRLFVEDVSYFNDNLKISPIYNRGKIESSPIFNSGILPIALKETKEFVLNNAGARKNISNLDLYDQSLLDDVLNKVSVGYNSEDFSELSTGTPYIDTDSDGMSDEWEKTTFGDLSKAPNEDEDEDGYTNLEAFLFSLASKK